MIEALRRSAWRFAGPIGLSVAVALFAAPVALAAPSPGSLSQLPSPNNCIGGTPECGTASTANLSGAHAVVVSPDGKNVYMVDGGSVSEFSRNSNGSLAELPAPNDCIGASSGCVNATGINFAQEIAVSPDGRNVYVTGSDSNGIGAIAEFSRNADGSLTQLTGANDCIGETEPVGTTPSACRSKGHGLAGPVAVAVSPDGANVYVADRTGSAVAEFLRNANGSLTQLTGANDCFEEAGVGPDCQTTNGSGLSGAESLAISPDGRNIYVGGDDTIAELTRNADGSLSQPTSPNNCIQEQADGGNECGTESGVGLRSIVSLQASPDGRNVYSSEGNYTGAVAEFARNADGSLTQLSGANDCIEENSTGDGQSSPEGCGTKTGHGLGEGGTLVVSPDGANVYVAATSDDCNPCRAAIAEFARNRDGTLTQLPAPDNCIEEQGGSDCGTETGTGLAAGSSPGLAVAPGSDSVYATGIAGNGDIAEFARPLATLTVSLAGQGNGTVSDGTGAISCAPTCSHNYPVGTTVTLTASAGPGSAFAGWSGAGCSGTGTCQVPMTANAAVTATFNVQSTSPAAGAPAVSASGPFNGSVNPNGLPTTALFQYGLDPKYTGASGIAFTQSTPAQSVGSDFTSHGVFASVSGLVPNALYHVRLVATNSAGTTVGPDVTFITPKTAPPGSPVLGKFFNVSVVSGIVLVELHGRLVPLTELEQIPAGTLIDALHGTLALTTALNGGSHARDAAAKGRKGKKAKPKTQTGQFGGAIFKITQAHSGLATLTLVEGAFGGAPNYASCKAHKSVDASAAALSSKTLQLLHASAHGKFRTTGRYSAATVRGTKWTIADKCNGTLTHDITDSVAVSDFVHHKTIILHAGQSYLARAPKRR